MNKDKTYNIVMAGGGTGGHYYPALAFVNELSKKYQTRIIYFATKGRIEEKYLPVDIPWAKVFTVELTGLKRPVYSFENFSVIKKMYIEKSRIKKIIKDFSPDFGFLTGGYISAPVGLNLRDLKVPFFLHEQNSIIGFTNRRLSKYAQKVFVSFQETVLSEKFLLTGNPVRLPKNSISREYLCTMGIKDTGKRTVLVFGGSLSSEKIDELMLKVYPLDTQTNFIHVTRQPDLFEQFKNVFTREYIPDIYNLLAICDGVICRAGATSIAEIKYFGLKALLVPWRGAAEDHQFRNALSLEKLGLADIIAEDEKDISKITGIIQRMPNKGSSFVWNVHEDTSAKKIIDNIEQLI